MSVMQLVPSIWYRIIVLLVEQLYVYIAYFRRTVYGIYVWVANYVIFLVTSAIYQHQNCVAQSSLNFHSI